MSRKLLIETKTNALSLVKDAKPKVPGCLGTISGPCADWKEATRNGNYYSRKLWENVRKSDLVVEALETKTLIGELDHPGDRLETKAANAAIVMTDFEVNDDGNVYGTFDILDTPNGRIMKTLLDYGCKLGVSSRGEGDVTDTDKGAEVDEDSYYFVAFDSVVTPAVKKARPGLTESLKRETLKESIVGQVNSATSLYELEVIKKVVESAKLPDLDSILESIDNKSKELEGTTDSSNLLEDLESANREIDRLKNENKELRSDVATAKSLREELVNSKKQMIRNHSQLKRSYEEQLEESKCSVFESASLRRDVQNLKTELGNSRDTIRRLREELRTTGSHSSTLESRISNLEESLRRSQESNRSKSKVIESLKKQVESVRSEYESKLEESKKVADKAIQSAARSKTSLTESTQKVNEILTDYATRRAEESGLNSSVILESVKPGMSLKDIDHLISEELDRSDRYRSLPMAQDRLLSSYTKARIREDKNEETSQTEDFISRALNLK